MAGRINAGDTIERTEDGERTTAVVMCRTGGTHLHVVYLTDNNPDDWGVVEAATWRASDNPVDGAVKDAATVYFLTATRTSYDNTPFKFVAAAFWMVAHNTAPEIQAEVPPSPALLAWREQNDPCPISRAATRRPHGRAVTLVMMLAAVTVVLAACVPGMTSPTAPAVPTTTPSAALVWVSGTDDTGATYTGRCDAHNQPFDVQPNTVAAFHAAERLCQIPDDRHLDDLLRKIGMTPVPLP